MTEEEFTEEEIREFEADMRADFKQQEKSEEELLEKYIAKFGFLSREIYDEYFLKDEDIRLNGYNGPYHDYKEGFINHELAMYVDIYGWIE